MGLAGLEARAPVTLEPGEGASPATGCSAPAKGCVLLLLRRRPSSSTWSLSSPRLSFLVNNNRTACGTRYSPRASYSSALRGRHTCQAGHATGAAQAQHARPHDRMDPRRAHGVPEACPGPGPARGLLRTDGAANHPLTAPPPPRLPPPPWLSLSAATPLPSFPSLGSMVRGAQSPLMCYK